MRGGDGVGEPSGDESEEASSSCASPCGDRDCGREERRENEEENTGNESGNRREGCSDIGRGGALEMNAANGEEQDCIGAGGGGEPEVKAISRGALAGGRDDDPATYCGCSG